MTTAVIVVMTKEEAKRLTDRIRQSAEKTWELLVEAHDRKAWKALGYTSFQDYVGAEFRMSRGQAYRLLDKGVVVKALRAAADLSPTQDQMGDIPERKARAIRHRLPEAVERIEAGETVDAVVRDLTANGHAEPPIDAEIVDPTPAIHPSSTRGGAVDVAVPPSPAGGEYRRQSITNGGSGTPEHIEFPAAIASWSSGSTIKDAYLGDAAAAAEADVDDVEAEADLADGEMRAALDTLSHSPADPSPAEPEFSSCSTGASEGAPPEHWAVAELRLVKDQLWEVTVARDAALLEAERLWKELKEARDAAEVQRDTLAQVMWTGLGLLGMDTDGNDNPRATIAGMGYDGYAAMFLNECVESRRLYDEALALLPPPIVPARSIVEEEPERFAADEMDESEPADDERRRAVRVVLAGIDALPPKERARFIRSHRITDATSWTNARTDAELTTLAAQFGEEGA